MAPTSWHPYFCFLPRKVQEKWCWLEFVEKRFYFQPVQGYGNFRGIEEYRCSPSRS